MNDERLEEWLELYLLGSLEPEEAARVEAALARDPDLRRAAADLQRTIVQLLEVAPEVKPAPHLKAQLLKRVRASRALEPRPKLSWWQRLAPGLALTTVVVAVGLAIWNISLTGQVQTLAAQNATAQAEATRLQQLIALFTAPGVQVAQLASPTSALVGETYWNTTRAQALFVVHNLPPIPTDKTYQLWLIGPNGAESVGFLQVDAEGRGHALVSLTSTDKEFSAAGISLEPASGSPQPTDVILLGDFNS